MLRPYDLKSLCLAAGVLTFFATSFSPAAHAVLKLSLDDGGGPTIVTDIDGDGEVFFTGALTNFTSNLTGGISKPILTGAPTLIDLTSRNVSNSAGSLIVELSDTDYTNPTSYLISAIGGTTGGTVTYETFVSTTNGDPFAGTQLALQTLTGNLGGNFSTGGQFSINLPGGTPYSVGIRVTIDHEAGNRVTSFDSEIRVPEPGSLGLLGTGLVLAGLALKRRRKMRQT